MEIKIIDQKILFHIHTSTTIDEILEKFHISRKMKYLYYQNYIYVNDQQIKSNIILHPNDILYIHMINDYEPIPFDEEPIEILYEDELVLIINKPANILVHSDGINTQHTLCNRVQYYYHQTNQKINVRPLHRLDIETSGIIIFSKNSFFQPLLDYMMENKHIHREYDALCEGIIEQDKISIQEPIGRDRHHQNKMIVYAKGKPAITHVKVIKRFHAITWIKCKLETGRTHQIRVHLAYIHHALLNDRIYGKRNKRIDRLALHSSSISFYHPLKQEYIKIECPLPKDMKKLAS